MPLSFTRRVNRTLGVDNSGDIVDAAHINELQVALEGITTGALPIALAGIEGALGESTGAMSVKSAGASGNGLDDDTASIALARSDLGSRYLYFPDGTYLTDPLTATAPESWVLGPNATVKLNGGPGDHMLLVTASGFTLDGGCLDAASANGAYSVAMMTAGLSDITFRRTTFKRSTGNGVRSKGATGAVSQNIVFDDCTFHDIAGHAIYFNFETENSVVRNCRFFDIANNAIWAGNTSRDLHILDNRMTGVGRMGIEVYGGSGKTIVRGNRVRATTSMTTGISIDDSGGSLIDGNIVDVDGGTINEYGIELAGGYRHRCANNLVDGAFEALSVDSIAQAIITGNHLLNSTGPYGVQMVDGAGGGGGVATPNHILFAQNVIQGSAQRGVQVNNNCDLISILGNHFVGNVRDDLWLNAATNVVVDRNVFAGSGSYYFVFENGGGPNMIGDNLYVGTKTAPA